MITVILNCYKRPEYLQEQISAIKNQSIPPDDIMVWYNKPEEGEQYNLKSEDLKIATCNYNFKFHGRFAYGLLAKTKYVAFFDDDTIPGRDWFKNCLDNINSNSILGSAGILFEKNNYDPHHKIGWNGIHYDSKQEVDLVGHAWFMERNILQYLWRQEQVSWDNGEDIQLSAFAYIYGRIKTYVPPHPKNNTNIWGSIKGLKYGNDDNASYKILNHSPLRNKIVNTLTNQGYVIVKNR